MMNRTSFFCIAFIMLCYVTNSIARNFVTEQTVYKANKQIFDSLLNQRVPEGIVRISHIYNIPQNKHRELKHYVKQREFRLLCQDYLLKDSLVNRVETKLNIEQCYTDSINILLIPVEGNHISGENLSYALRCKDMLELDSVQYDYIMNKAVDMARRIKSDYRTAVWNEEMEILKTTLDKHQLQSFFRSKNAKRVTTEFDNIMKKLEDAGLTEQIDSVKDVPDAVNYLFYKQMIKDLYRNFGTSQKRYLSEIDKNKPKIISLFDGLIKKERYREEEQNLNFNKEFIW